MAELCLKREQKFYILFIMLKTTNSLYFYLNIYWNLFSVNFILKYPLDFTVTILFQLLGHQYQKKLLF